MRSYHHLAFAGILAAAPAPAATLKVLHSLTTAEGAYPTGHLAVDHTGSILGLTVSGGAANHGTVFALSPPAAGATSWTLRVLHSFSAAESPPEIFSGVTIAPDGTAYGVTENAVFSIAPTGGRAYTNLLSFSATFGHAILPGSSLLIGADGALYVTDQEGGPARAGAVYRIAHGQSGWSVTDIHDFNGVDGFFPKGDLLADASGNLYGTTQAGGANQVGNVYELSPPAGQGAWTIATLASFARRGGNTPDSGLARDASGTFYGTTSQTGFGPRGTLYSLAGTGGTWTLSELAAGRIIYGSNAVLPLGNGSLLTADGTKIVEATVTAGVWSLAVIARNHDVASSFGPPVAGPGAVYYLASTYGRTEPLGQIFQLTP